MRKVILLLIFVACSALNALAQSFALSGSEHGIVNGVYTFVGVNKLNQPVYMHKSGQYEIFYDNNGTWWLGTDKNLSGGTQYYKASGTAAEIPLTGWVNDRGQSAPVLLVADPRNAEIIAARNAAPVLIKGLGDNSPNRTFEIAYVTGTGHPVVQDSLPLIGNTAQRGANTVYYMTNLRVSGYRINNSGCSFGLGENPDPRYRIRNNFGYDQVLNPGNDKNCDVNNAGTNSLYITPLVYNNSIPISAASPFQMTFDIDAWEEDGCESDNEYNTSCVNDDEYPAYLTNFTQTFNPNNMYVGRTNSAFIEWTGNSTTYTIFLSWELAEADRLVSVYADANHSGRVQQFGVGEYDFNSLRSGVGNDAISSMLIAPGYKVTVYNLGDFTGYPTVLRGNINITGYNDKISSIKIEQDNNPQPIEGKTLLIYFNGSGKDIKFQLERNASKIKADEMIFIKGVGGDEGPSSISASGPLGSTIFGTNPFGTYVGYNANNFAYQEGELLYDYFEFPSIYYSHVNVFKNTNANAAPNSYLFGVDMQYDGTVVEGFEDQDSYVAASNVLRVLERYNLRGYDTILISGHSRGSAVGITSLLYGIKKAVTNTGFNGFAGVVNDVFTPANVINVLALDPVAGENTSGFTNDYHMGGNFHMDDIYSWFKGQYPNSNFSEIYANGAKQREHNLFPEGGTPFFWEKKFDPSPNYLYNNPANNVQRYWLGYRHSSMENNTEKLSDCYDSMSVDRPWLHTVEMENAALHNQTLFRNYSYWYNKFRKSDTDGWQGALKIDGCTSPDASLWALLGGALHIPDRDLEMQYFHGTRHTDFDNIGGTSVNMDAFVGNNNIEFQCTGNSPTPTAAGTYTADRSLTDASGWTHYCTCKGELLLGINNATPPAASEVQLVVTAALSASNVPSYTGFIVPASSVMNRKWSINSTNMTGTVSIRDYFDKGYVDAVSALTGQGRIDSSKMWFYKAAVAPTVPLANIPVAETYTNGTTPSFTQWKLGRSERSIYAEYLTNAFTLGSGGGGSTLSGNPLCFKPNSNYVEATSGLCTGGIRNVSLSSSETNVNYQLFRDGTAVGSPIAGTGSTIYYGDQTVSGTYTVEATSLVGGCKAMMNGSIVVNIGTQPNTVLYVDANATGNGDGSSWTNAITSLNVALARSLCPNLTTIKVAAGTYKPNVLGYSDGGITPIIITDPRDVTFAVSGGMVLEGGYNPATGTRTVGTSILSGDLSGNDVITGSGNTLSITGNAENAYHVVSVLLSNNIAQATTTVNGFTITGGNANGSGNSSYSHVRNEGGGIAANLGTRGTNVITNNTVYGNSASNSGGGISTLAYEGNNTITNNTVYNNSSNIAGGIYAANSSIGTGIFTNNTLYGNSAAYPGGLYVQGGTNTIANNTFYNNAATNTGGGLLTGYSTNTVINNIFWGNKKNGSVTDFGADYRDFGGASASTNTLKNNLLQLASSNYTNTAAGNYHLGTAASGNLFAQDPYFVDAANSNFQIGACSPATDAGTNTGTPALDLTGNAIFNTTKDIGAYERQTELCPVYANTANGCQTITLNNVTGNQWFYFNNNKGRVAAINPNGQNLGTVTVEVNDANSALTVGISKFLGRNVNINSTTAPTQNYTLRLYYYDTELTEYNTATNGTFALTDFNMAWASGGASGTGCDLEAYRASATTNGLVAKADVTEAEYGASNNGFYLELNLNHFTAFAATTTGGTPLPVKLLAFTGTKDKNGHRLNWITATEQNSSYFEVQTSPDLAQGGEWKPIGNVRAAGNSNTPKYYDFTNQPIKQSTNQPIYYYRLKMIDFDGSFDYSNVISITEKGEKDLVKCYPNPTTNILNIDATDRTQTVTVTDEIGRTVQTHTITPNTIDLSALPAGMYHIRVGYQHFKIVKL